MKQINKIKNISSQLWVIVFFMIASLLSGCVGNSNSSTNSSNSNQVVLGTLPNGSEIVVSAKSNALPITVGDSSSGTLSLVGGSGNTNYTVNFPSSQSLASAQLTNMNNKSNKNNKLQTTNTDDNGITVSTPSDQECVLNANTNKSCNIKVSVASTTPAGTYQIRPVATNQTGNAILLAPMTILVSGTSTDSATKDITQFNLAGVDGIIVNNNIIVNLPYGTELNSLVARYVTTGEKVTVSNKIQDNGVTANDFTNPVIYTVTAKDGSVKNYTVTATVAENSANSITSFNIGGNIGQIGNGTISVNVPFGTDITNLVAVFNTTGEKVTVNGVTQVSYVTANDFTKPVEYIVTAEDGSTQKYIVNVNIAASPAKEITSYSLNGNPGIINGNNITVIAPYGTNLTNMIATFSTTGVKVSIGDKEQISDFTENNFTKPVNYTITAADGTLQHYTVTVFVNQNSANDIAEFSLNGIPANTITGNQIIVTLPYGSDVTALTANFVSTGTKVLVGEQLQTSGVTTNDFTNPVTYTVVAEDGSTHNYSVIVKVSTVASNAITSYSINGSQGSIVNNDISVIVPEGTNTKNLVATFTTTGTKVTVHQITKKFPFTADIEQISGVTSNGFSLSNITPVVYTVTGADGKSQDYNVRVTTAPSSAKQITSFSINGTSGLISGQDINVTLPAGTSPSLLVAKFSTTGAKVTVNGIPQVSGISPNDFTEALTYTVTAEDDSTQDYTVSVEIAAPVAKSITSFSLNGNQGIIGNSDILVYVPFGTKVDSMIASFTIDGQKLMVGDNEQISDVTPNNFTNPINYTVVANDGTTKDYTVTVVAADVAANDLTSYSINGVDGVFSGHDIDVILPAGTNASNLVANFTTTGKTVTVVSSNIIGKDQTQTQVSGKTANDFTNPVVYHVTAINGNVADYTVTVHIPLSTEKAITSYSINGYEGVINGTNINLTMPFATNLQGLVAKYTTTGKSVTVGLTQQILSKIDPTSLTNDKSGITAHDFGLPVKYTVVAENGSKQTYTVTVKLANPDSNALTSIALRGNSILLKAGYFTDSNHIVVPMPYGTDVRHLLVKFTTNGTKVYAKSDLIKNVNHPLPQFSGKSIHDFTNPVVFTVIGSNGQAQDFTVSVDVAKQALSSFSLVGVNLGGGGNIGVFPGVINGNDITVTLPKGTTGRQFGATFTNNGIVVLVGKTPQIQAVSQNDYTNPVTFMVFALPAKIVKYTVHVVESEFDANSITSYSLNVDGKQYIGDIDDQNDTINVAVPAGTDVTKLVANFTSTADTVSVIGTPSLKNPNPLTTQVSGVTTNDFSKTVTYSLASASLSVPTLYKVHVSFMP